MSFAEVTNRILDDSDMDDADPPCAAGVVFRLTFDEPRALTNMVQVVGSVLDELDVEVCKAADFTGLAMKSMDPKQVSVVIARLACTVDLPPSTSGKVAFRVRTSALLPCLKAIPQSSVLVIEQREGGPELHVSGTDPSCAYDRFGFSIATLVPGATPPVLNDMTYEFHVDIDLNTFRSLIRMCKDLKAEDVAIQIHTRRPGGDDAGPSSFFCIKGAGDEVQLERYFVSLDAMSDQCANNSALDYGQAEQYEVACVERFSTEYLSLFMKHMEKTNINIRISAHKPLILTYPLDESGSMVCFVLANRHD